MERHRRARRGFTLIELLVVMVILALLVGLVAPRLLGQMNKGQVGSAKAQINNLKTAVEMYRVDHAGQLPSGLQDLLTPPASGSSAGQWKGPYLSDATSVPRDPWGNEFIYDVPGPAGQDYEIRSLGSDGKEGGDGDAADLSNIQ